ncbi:SpoIIE family protein phosphatase [Ancylomarina sp.]|uniref:SpoIIE family protein phosphatase n=1 Tax=Ancylomarina sp. TaxID=1970196 RepID=UPI00356780BD
MAENLLSEKMDLVELKMSDFFSTVEKAFIISYKRGISGAYQNREIEELNMQFSPVLECFESISAVDLADEMGNDYMLKYSHGSYVNLITREGCIKRKLQKIEWFENNGELNILKKDTLDIFFDPRLRLWFKGAIDTEEDVVFWTQPYQFATSNVPGITISKKWEDSTGIENVISFDVSILDISKFTSQMEISTHGKTFIVTDDGRFLGLPKDERFRNENDLLGYLLIDTDSLGIPEIIAAKKEIVRHAQRKDLYTFHFNGGRYFLKVKPFVLGDNTFRICLLIPEKDLTDDIQMIRWLVMLIILVIALMAILMAKAYHSKRKANELLSTQKQELEEKNHEVEDSIHYAKHLQEAILPSSALIKNLFPQSFILYKPKDIVSGDFYWIHSFDRMIYFAVADCTGHGVPGAMVSVVCANALNRVIKEYDIIEPGKVLDHVKKYVVDAFSQSEDGVSDGMDIALCCIDLDINKLWYSGANNSLYRVSQLKNMTETPKKSVYNKNRILYEYPATRQPIGTVTETKKFKTHEIDLKQGDSIYLFSDGFSDQFGGPKGKKYRSKPLKQFLLKISEKSMAEQKYFLDDEFEAWKGDEEQVDDICILGVKI